MIKAAIVSIKNFLGVNRRDGADLVQNNEFFTLQNFYPKTKGLFYKREGSVQDLAAASIPMCSEIIGINRFSDPLGQRSTIYYCKPSGATIPVFDPTNVHVIGIGLANTGELRAGVNTVYGTYVGRGNESAPVQISAPNLPDNTRSYALNIVGSLPTGVQSINIYIKDGTSTNMQYAGTIGGSYGTTLTIRHRYAILSAGADIAKPTWSATTVVQYGAGGTLAPGTYYISCAWMHLNQAHAMDLAFAPPSTATNEYKILIVSKAAASIHVEMENAAGTDGTGEANRWLAIFIGLKPPDQAPMQYAGATRCYSTGAGGAKASFESLDIFNLFTGSNAQSAPRENASVLPVLTTTEAAFYPQLQSDQTSFSIYNADYGATVPKPFIVKQDSSGNLTEILFSGSGFNNIFVDALTVTQRATGDVSHTMWLLNAGSNISMVAFLGLLFIANSANLLLETDGYGLYETVSFAGTLQPGVPRSLLVLKNQLCMTVLANKAGTRIQNQVYGSATLDPYNWADGGSGTDVRFATIGDGFADGISAIGLFSFNSATDGPSAFLACAKKASIWLLSNIPDSTGGTPASANSISNRTGCLAQNTMIPTNIGLMFLGSDGDVYLISNTGGEPRRIGNRIRPILEHLAANETLMRRATACFHQGFYKLSYPSASTSTVNDAEIWADLRTEQGAPITWCGPHLGLSVGKQIVFLLEGDQNERLCSVDGSNQTAFLNDTSTFQDLGAAITSIMEWKTSRIDNGMSLKRFFGMMFDVFYDTTFAHEAVIEAFADDQYTQQDKLLSTGTGVWNSSNFDQTNWGDARFFALPVMFGPTNLVGRTFKWRLTHANNAQFIIAAANVIGKSEKRFIV